MPRLRQHSCLQAMPWVTLAEYANPGRVLSHMTRLRQHSCLLAYALGDLAKYANPGKVLSLHTQA